MRKQQKMMQERKRRQDEVHDTLEQWKREEKQRSWERQQHQGQSPERTKSADPSK
jgi:hypothetical protein